LVLPLLLVLLVLLLLLLLPLLLLALLLLVLPPQVKHGAWEPQSLQAVCRPARRPLAAAASCRRVTQCKQQYWCPEQTWHN
jgi:hypothetical protein